ncbi:CG9875, partial [Drosophila busckii]
LRSNRLYSEWKNNLPNLFLLGGGLGKLQGGIKEEEYFSSVNQGLMTNIRKHIENSKNADYMRNWEEYQKTLDHAALYNTTCINKHKDLHEEAFFMNEVS